MPVETITMDDGAVYFAIPSVDGSFEGELNGGNDVIERTWTQLGQSLPLDLEGC